MLRDTTSRGLYVRFWPPHTSERRGGPGGGLGGCDTMDCFEAPRMGLNLIFIKVSAAPTGALGPWKVEEP